MDCGDYTEYEAVCFLSPLLLWGPAITQNERFENQQIIIKKLKDLMELYYRLLLSTKIIFCYS